MQLRVPGPRTTTSRPISTLPLSVRPAIAVQTTSSYSGHPSQAMHSCIALVSLDTQSADLQPIIAKAEECRSSRVYVAVAAGGTDELPISSQLLDWLGELYGATGAVNARLDVVPCLTAAGWTADKLAALPDVQLLLSPATLQRQAQQLLQQLNNHRADAGSSGSGSSSAAELQVLPAVQQTEPAAAQKGAAGGAEDYIPDAPQQQQQQQLLFDHVAVGGTFDRLHAGHRLLLAATALICSKQVYIGITSDALLANKANKHLLHDYEQRRAGAVDFMVLVRPSLAVHSGALTDPQEPTQAELDPSMQALVVSHETLPGGEAINRGREGRGFAPLQLVMVKLVGGDGSSAGSKLSSTALREADAAAAAAAAAVK